MATCNAICKSGRQCSFKAKPGLAVCGKHMVKPIVIPHEVCGARKSDGTFCMNACGEGLDECPRHHNMRERRARVARARDVWYRVAHTMWTDRNPLAAYAIFEEAINNGDIAPEFAEDYVAAMVEEWEAYQQQVLGVPRRELEALATDAQNVHTGAVGKQTRDGMELLLDLVTPAGLNVPAEMAKVWADKHHLVRKSVLKDVRKWYKTKYCREEGDELYRKVLDGLWCYIRASEHKDELMERLWEECHESVGMCCEGHLSRLCNVMVGFDDAFKPPVSPYELLQQKMASLAAEDIDIHLKVERAWGIMEELQIPVEERDAWIEAL